MAESSYFWGGTTTGDAGPYTDDAFSDAFAKIFLRDRTTQGVLKGIGSELVVSNPSGMTLRVASGYGIVDGKIYFNTANVDTTISVPGALRYYRVVLRKSFTAQTVRVAILGPSVGSFPALTQNDGTTWEISLATFTIDASNVFTITDTRQFCVFTGNVATEVIADSAVTTVKIADLNVTGAKIANETITPDKIDNRTRRFYVPVENAVDDGTVINKISNGFGWMTNNSGMTWFQGAFLVPDDYVSDLMVYGLFANHGASNNQVVLNFQAKYFFVSGSHDTPTEENITGRVAVIPSGGTLYFDLFVHLPDVEANDLVELYAARDGANVNDTGTVAFGCQFHGFYVTYMADS